MNVTLYHSDAIVITSNRKEYDMLLYAVLVLEAAAEGSTALDAEQLKLIEDIRTQMQSIEK